KDRQAPGPHGPVPVRIYTPTAPAGAPRPVLVWCHGGAFMHGDLDMPEGDHVARGVAGRADAVVVSVDYRVCAEPTELGGQAARQIPGTVAEVRAPVPLNDVCPAVARVRTDEPDVGAGGAGLAMCG